LNDYEAAYAGRTLQPIELNVFAHDHWRDIDTTIIQHRPKADDEGDESGRKDAPRRTDP
jgi:hypothetical protein